MQKIKILQQYLQTVEIGGLYTEYHSLKKSHLLKEYEFIPMVLDKYHKGVNVQDIFYYYKIIKDYKPDIIHIRGANVDCLNAILAAKFARSGKILIAVHGMYSDMVYYDKAKKYICRYIIEPIIFGLADGISFVCETTKNRKKFGKYSMKILPTVYNRMPCFQKMDIKRRVEKRNDLKIPDNAKVALYVGRMTKEKGLVFFFEALEVLDKEWPTHLYFVFVGDGDYKIEMEKLCKKLVHNDRIIFCGQKTDVENYLFISDFFVQPSLHENLSIAILEACAAGVPVLATDVGGNKEIISEGVNGKLIQPRDTMSLVQGIKKMNDDYFRKQLKENLLNSDFSKFSNENVDKQLKEVYEKILKRNKNNE